MFNVCPSCGIYEIDKEIITRQDQNFAICSHCQHSYPFAKLPLLFLTGASGAGKSTIGLRLQRSLSKVIVLENDIFSFGNLPLPEIKESILRIAKNIHQNGKSVLQVGCNIPEHFELSLEKRYFRKFHYLALVCDNELLKERLKARPAWRACGEESYWKPQLEFNQWFKDKHAKVDPKIDIIDTTALTLISTERLVKTWIKTKI